VACRKASPPPGWSAWPHATSARTRLCSADTARNHTRSAAVRAVMTVDLSGAATKRADIVSGTRRPRRHLITRIRAARTGILGGHVVFHQLLPRRSDQTGHIGAHRMGRVVNNRKRQSRLWLSWPPLRPAADARSGLLAKLFGSFSFPLPTCSWLTPFFPAAAFSSEREECSCLLASALLLAVQPR